MPRFTARAEFRRVSRTAPWVLAGVWIDHEFHPVDPGVEPIRSRLPDATLVGWSDIEVPILAPGGAEAAEAAIELARATWPKRAAWPVPFAYGTADAEERSQV